MEFTYQYLSTFKFLYLMPNNVFIQISTSSPNLSWMPFFLLANFLKSLIFLNFQVQITRGYRLYNNSKTPTAYAQNRENMGSKKVLYAMRIIYYAIY